MKYIISISVIAALGGVLFGYDTAVISGAEQSLERYFIDDLGLHSIFQGLMVSSALVGCIVGGLVSSGISDKIGRKNSLIIAAFLFLISAIFSAYPEFLFFTKDEQTIGLFVMFNVYRIIGGVGVGLASGLGPLYISETSPANIRGRLTTLYNVAIIFGTLVVYIVNWQIVKGASSAWLDDLGWRFMFGSEAIPAVLFFGLMFFVPETPRYLALRNKDEEAVKVLTKVNGSKEKAMEIFQEIKQTVNVANNQVAGLFSYGKLVVIVGILLAVSQQFVGINVILYYAPRIFENMGIEGEASMLQTVYIGIVNLIFVLISLLLVEKVGRKLLLLIGSVGMAIGMFGIAILAYADMMGFGAFMFILLFVATYNLSFGPLVWTLASELFPNRVRGKIIGITVAANWGSNLLISSTFPSLLEIGEIGRAHV